jgi:hypothetical protein
MNPQDCQMDIDPSRRRTGRSRTSVEEGPMTIRRLGRLFLATAFALPLVGQAAHAADATKLTNDQLDELVAPVALYPDGLLSQVCIAATYPLEVVEADRWVKQNKLAGEALDKALEEKDWDQSVEYLCHFPDVLDRMSANLDWTQALGNAFLDQQAGVMDAVQRMRAKADAAGTLKSDAKQTVVKEQQTIVIQPADPQVVYVPTYPPTVYGPTYAAAPVAYPAVYPPTATWGGALLTFGAGMATGALIAGAFDWHDHDVYIHDDWHGGGHGHGNKNNVNVNKNVNINGKKWEHNPEHRRGVRYDNAADRQRFASRDRDAARDRAQRDAARGFGDGARDRDRPGSAGAGRPGDRPGAGGRPDRPGGRPEMGGRPDRPDRGSGGARPETHPSRPQHAGGQRPSGGFDGRGGGSPGAFGGYGNGRDARAASSRGAASRNRPSYSGGGGGGFGGRGGGGGHRGGGGGGGRRGGGGGRRR